MKNKAPRVLWKQLQTKRKDRSRWLNKEVKITREVSAELNNWIWQQKQISTEHQIHQHSCVFRPLLYAPEYCYPHPFICSALPVYTCSTLRGGSNKQARWKAGTPFSRGGSTVLVGEGPICLLTYFTRGPHTSIKGLRAAWKGFKRTLNAKIVC